MGLFKFSVHSLECWKREFWTNEFISTFNKFYYKILYKYDIGVHATKYIYIYIYIYNIVFFLVYFLIHIIYCISKLALAFSLL